MDESRKHSNEIGEGHDPCSIIQALVEKTKKRISEIPSSPSEPAAIEKLCIFKLPQRFKNVNRMWNTPQVVAIGPYNRHKPELQATEEIKLLCLNFFIDKTRPTSQDLDVYYRQIYPHVKEVRECYSKDDSYLSVREDEFLEMMLVDGCFILSFLLFYMEEETSDHPLYRLDTVTLRKIYGDLLLLENQIPSVVLVKLYEIYSMPNTTLSLKNIAIKVFMRLLGVRCPIRGHELERKEFKWFHLLDIVRNIFVQSSVKMMAMGGSQIPCVTKLRHVGIKISRPHAFWAKNILDVSFRARGSVIHIPKIILDHEMCLLLMNCVALEEQCHNITPKPFLSYAVLLDCLVNTAKDIEYLGSHRPGIMEHIFETDAEAADFINNLGKGLTSYNKSDLSRAVNTVYRERLVYQETSNWFRWQWRSFKQEFFGKSWLLISAFVGLALLVLTYLQTHFTIYAYMHPKC
jgi:hypothetical protein